MSLDETQEIAALVQLIQGLSQGRPYRQPSRTFQADSRLAPLWQSLQELGECMEVLRRFSVQLANGRIDTEAPFNMHLLDPLKSLQASLRHLTWQTQQIAAGDFEQHVDFLGDFSVAFNQMTAALKDKRKAEQQAMRAAQLASIGQLAAGIAHEINTPAQYVGDNLKFIRESFASLFSMIQGDVSLAREDIGLMKQDMDGAVTDSLTGIEQITRIVRSMKEFSRPGTTERIQIDVNQTLESTLTVCQNEWRTSVDIQRNYAPDLPYLLCYPAEISQVFLSILLNGIYAINTSGKPLPGKIEISTALDGDQLVIQFTDSGLGVDESLREKIFDPFFTTKPVGRGTGQGLAIARDIIESRHGGRIEVGGSVGEGAVFTLRLPITQAL